MSSYLKIFRRAKTLLWTALSPLFRNKKVIKDIRRLIQLEERSIDSDT